jgi:hypothetical protein
MKIKTTVTGSELAAAAQVLLTARRFGADNHPTDQDMMNAIGDLAEKLALPMVIQISAFASLQLTFQRLKNGATE